MWKIFVLFSAVLATLSFSIQLMVIHDNVVSLVTIENEEMKDISSFTLPFSPSKGIVVSNKAYFVSGKELIEYDLEREEIVRKAQMWVEDIRWSGKNLLLLSKKKILLLDPVTFSYTAVDLPEDPVDVETFEDELIVSYGKYVSLVKNREETWKIEAPSAVVDISVNAKRKVLAGITKDGTLFLVDLENVLAPKIVFFTGVENAKSVEWLENFLFVSSENRTIIMDTEKLNTPEVVKEYNVGVSSFVKTDGSIFFTSGNILYRMDSTLSMKRLGVAQRVFLVLSPEKRVITAGELLWKRNLGSEVRASPAVSDKLVLVADVEGVVHAMSLNGTRLWEYRTGFVVTAPPKVYLDRVYVTSWDNFLYAISENGNLVWKVELESDVSKPFEVNSYGVYLATDGGRVYLIDHGSETLWQFKDDEWVSTGVTVDENGTVYFGTLKNLYSLYPNGSLKWKTKTGYLLTTKPVVVGKYVFVGSNSGWLFCFDRLNGSVIWKKELPLTLNSTLSVYKDLLIINGSDGIYLVDFQGNVKDVVFAESPSPVAVSKEGFLFFVSNGTLFSYTIDGQKRWERKVGETIAEPAIGEERVIVATRDGTVYCFFDSAHP
ncbi:MULTISPECIES: PQQ-binding-like beta-propeller repeat protein [Thermotoga]|jgi:outer membrane protein assembly factor BamB|nr:MULTISPECIES: PQQ-binding-like beta-propeller repeat protein [Thermotoga]AJG41247.1 pyrrolo-quinoline quinone [Thermotoga sp. RQ7]KFZ21599.1 Pyrrolo-quinoline quinone precursor [Thermotoga neapolitana LA10]HBF11398.1 pyrrolo-quinoline quinone [Thermotoga neapolitana]